MGDDDDDDDDGNATSDGATGYNDDGDGNGQRQGWHDKDGNDDDGNVVTGDGIRRRWRRRPTMTTNNEVNSDGVMGDG